MEITFTLRKNGSYMPSGLGGSLFPVDRQAGRQTKFSFKKILNKSITTMKME